MKRIIALAAALLFMPVAVSAEVVEGSVTASIGGTSKTLIGSASPTSCTAIETNKNGALNSIIDGSGMGQTEITLFLYDEGASPTCSTSDQLYAVSLLPGQIITLNMPLTHGLAYKIVGGAANSNIIVNRV